MLALLLCLASASPWACRPQQILWRVVQLRLEGFGDDAEGARLRAGVAAALAASPGFAVQLEGDDADQDRDVDLQLRLMGQGLQVSLAPHVGFGAQFEAVVPLQGQAELPQAVAEGLGVALTAIRAMKRADDGGLQKLRAALAPPEQGSAQTVVSFNLQFFAVRRLAQRRDLGALGALRGLVVRAGAPGATPQDEALALQAVGSLVALGDRQAVLPMIALTRQRPPTFVVQMAHAIGALGGPMAEAFLVTLASGHLDGEVREAAATALDELGRRGPLPPGHGTLSIP